MSLKTSASYLMYSNNFCQLMLAGFLMFMAIQHYYYFFDKISIYYDYFLSVGSEEYNHFMTSYVFDCNRCVISWITLVSLQNH